MTIIKKTIHRIALIFLVLNLLSCAFDQSRQFDLRYPVELIIENKQLTTINVTSIYNSNDTLAGFVLQGSKIAVNGNIKIRMSETTFQAIENGKYIIEGACENEPEWRTNGSDIRKKTVRSNVEWSITLYIDKC